MRLTPFGDRNPFESSSSFAQRVREEDEEKKKLKRLDDILEESKRQSNFFETSEIQKLRNQVQEQQAYQNKTYRGILSGVTGLLKTDNVTEKPKTEGLPEDDGVNLNPFHYLAKGAMGTLGAWQKATEYTAGVVASPFSEQVQTNMKRGYSPGESWRRSKFATTRIGAEKDEKGFGFNLGVKGAVELLVDPIGLATMALPVGAIVRPIGKGVSTVASTLPGIKQVRKAGTKKLKEGKKFDKLIRETGLYQNKVQDILKSYKGAYQKKLLAKERKKEAKRLKLQGFKRNQIKDLIDSRSYEKSFNAINGRKVEYDSLKVADTQQHLVFDVGNYDQMLEKTGINREGLVGDFLRVLNSNPEKTNIIARPFMIGLRNVHKMYNPAYTQGNTMIGRAGLAHNFDLSLINSQKNAALAFFNDTQFEDLWDVNKVTYDVATDDGLNLIQNRSIVTSNVRKERIIDKPVSAKERTVRFGQEQAKESELRISNIAQDGSFSIYNPNVATRIYGKIKNVDKKFTGDIADAVEDSKLIQETRSHLNNGEKLYSDYTLGSKKAIPIEEALQPGKGYKIDIADVEFLEVDTYAIGLARQGAIGKKGIKGVLQKDLERLGVEKSIRELAVIQNNILALQKKAITKKSKNEMTDRTGLAQLKRDQATKVKEINNSISTFYDNAFSQKNVQDYAFGENKEAFKKMSSSGEDFQTVNLSNAPGDVQLEQIKNTIFGSSKGVKAGTVKVGGKFRSPINDAETASSYLKQLKDGLEANNLFIESVGKKATDIQTMFPDNAKAIMRNFSRALDDSSIAGKNKIKAIRYNTNEGQVSKHFGHAFKLEGKNKNVTWNNLTKLGAISDDTIDNFIKKYPEIKTDFKNADKIAMETADFLDLGGYVIDQNGPMGRPVRLYEEYFDLTEDQMNWLSHYYGIFDEGAALMHRHNIPMNNLFENTTGNYVHHIAEAFAEYLDLDTARGVASQTGKALPKSSILKGRMKEFVSDGIEQSGYKYNENPLAMASTFLDGVYSEIANAKYIRRAKVVAEKQLAGKKIVYNKYKAILDNAKDLKTQVDQIKFLTDAQTNVAFASYSDRLPLLVTTIDDFVTANKFESLNPETPSWLKVKKDVESLIGGKNVNDQAVKIQEKLNNWIDDVVDNRQTALNAQERKIEALRAGVDIGETKRKLSGLYGKEIVYARMVQDQRKGRLGNEVKALLDEGLMFPEDTAKAIEKNLGITKENSFDNFFNSAAQVNDTIRVAQTGFDAGTWFLHGLPTMMRGIASIPRKGLGEENFYLKSWTAASKEMFNTIFMKGDAKRHHASMIYRKKENFQRMAQYGVLTSSAGADYFAVRESKKLKKLFTEGRLKNSQKVNAIPGFNNNVTQAVIKGGAKTLDNYQTSFEMFGDVIREGLWEGHYNQIIKSKKTFAEQEQSLTQLGEYINSMTGAFSSKRAGIGARQQSIERSVIFFSPSYTRATLGLMGSVLSGGLQQQEAMKSIRAMMGAGLAMHIGTATVIAETTGQNWEDLVHLDPSKGNFLTHEVGGVNVGFGSAWMSMARTLGKIAADPAFRGDILDSPLLLTGSGRGQDGFDEMGIKDYLSNHQLVAWLRTRAAPAGSTFWDLGMGANFLGEEMKAFSTDFFTHLGSQSLPFWLQGMFEDGAPAGISDFFGLRTVPVSDWEKRSEVRDMLSQQYFETSYRNLNDNQKRFITESPDIETDPNRQRLGELDSNIQEKRRVVGGSQLDRDMEARQYEVEDIRQVYLNEVEEANERAKSGELSIEQYIKVEQKLRGQYGREMFALETKYENVEAYFETLRQTTQMGEFERIEDYAADEYAQIMFDEEFDLDFMYDFNARELALQEWRDKYTNPEFEKYANEKLFGRRWDATPLNHEFYGNRAKYFPTYYEGSRKLIFKDRYQGRFDDVYSQWYEAKFNDVKRKELETQYPAFKTALNEWEELRESIRKTDPSIDAFLYRFGYTTTLLNSNNQGREYELKLPFMMESYIPPWKVAGQ